MKKLSATDLSALAAVDRRITLRPGRPRFPDDIPWTPPRSVEKIELSLRVILGELTTGNRPWPLVLLGEAGSGKTCAALCAVDRYGGWYQTLPDFCRKVIDAQHERLVWSSGHLRSEHELWAAWADVPLAVLDEIGARERVSDFHYETLKRLIDLREGKPAIFVSNLPLELLYQIYDDRIASRLTAGTIYCTGRDRRLGEPEAVGP